MPSKKLTDSFVNSAKPINGNLTEFSDQKERGLCLRITSKGVKSWTFRYRDTSGKQKRISIGRIDDVSLAEARNRVIKHRADILSGIDPVLNIKNQKLGLHDKTKTGTLKSIGENYYAACLIGQHSKSARGPKRPSTLRVEKPYFTKLIIMGDKKNGIEGLGNWPIQELNKIRIEDFLAKVRQKRSVSAARHSQVILHSIFEYAIWQDLLETNPCSRLSKPKIRSRERVLTDQELQQICSALTDIKTNDGPNITKPVINAILLAIVTLQRRSEITGMKLAELDFAKKTWTISGDRTKNHRTHVVPLSDLAIQLIQESLNFRSTTSAFVFPSPRATINSDKPIDGQALTRAFIRLRETLNLHDIRPHDFRRTGATNLTGEELGFPVYIVSKVLNHLSDKGGAGSVTSVYDRNEYLTDKRRALNAWADKVINIVGLHSRNH